jgi:hypothetical protein
LLHGSAPAWRAPHSAQFLLRNRIEQSRGRSATRRRGAVFTVKRAIYGPFDANEAADERTQFDQGAAFLFLLGIGYIARRIDIECIID